MSKSPNESVPSTASHPNSPIPMAETNNTESTSLFDDYDESLNKICFDFEERGRDDPKKSWCTSSDNSSCCSLCRLSCDSVETTDDVASDVAGFGDLESMETLTDLVSSSGLVSFPAAAQASFSTVATNPNNSGSTSAFAPSDISRQPQAKSCQACCCSINNVMVMPSLFGSCGECQSASLNLPVKANFMTQFASKNSSFLSFEEKLKLQSLLFPSSIPRQTDLLTAGFLPEDHVYSILSFLDVNTLVNLRLVNSKLRSLSSDNNAGWKHHCTMLWSRKVRVCPDAKRLLDCANTPEDDHADAAGKGCGSSSNGKRTAMEAYKASVLESKSVNELSEDDLCFDVARDASGVMWSFRFKESAGMDWTSWDPWWKNKLARKLVFMRNGSILQSHPPGRSPTVTTHNFTQLYDVFSERLVQRNGVDIIPPRIEMRWRFVSSCMDLPRRPAGAYVRITVGGRDVPTYVVRRSPNGNWGFIMESCWGLYASFELGARDGPTSSLNVAGRRALRRTRNGSLWVNIEDADNENAAEEADETTRNVRRRPNPNMVVEESAMTVTGISQWREALLYNIGAVSLPEGNNASNQFDAAWHNALLLR